MIRGIIRSLLCAWLLAGPATAQTVTVQRSENIFDQAAFASSHASTIVSLDSGVLMSAWFGGVSEGRSDVSIWGSIFQNKKWGSPILLADGITENGTRYACWNPVLFKTKQGSLFLHYKVGPSPREWWGMYKVSNDNGSTWSGAKRLPENFLGPIKNKPVQLPSGNILYPSSTESQVGDQWMIHMEISDAALGNWKNIPIPSNGFGVIQPTILRYPDGRLQLLCRSRQKVIAQSWSEDGGTTWSAVTATTVSNPNSGIDAVTLQNGMQLLVYNPLPSGNEVWEHRSVLRVAISKDGIHWRDIHTLEEHATGEYSYPAVIQDTWGNVHITYTAQRKWIRHAELSLQ
jgi:predicted neuraminidase